MLTDTLVRNLDRAQRSQLERQTAGGNLKAGYWNHLEVLSRHIPTWGTGGQAFQPRQMEAACLLQSNDHIYGLFHLSLQVKEAAEPSPPRFSARGHGPMGGDTDHTV